MSSIYNYFELQRKCKLSIPVFFFVLFFCPHYNMDQLNRNVHQKLEVNDRGNMCGRTVIHGQK